jgi:hypothetical protein
MKTEINIIRQQVMSFQEGGEESVRIAYKRVRACSVLIDHFVSKQNLKIFLLTCEKESTKTVFSSPHAKFCIVLLCTVLLCTVLLPYFQSN